MKNIIYMHKDHTNIKDGKNDSLFSNKDKLSQDNAERETYAVKGEWANID